MKYISILIISLFTLLPVMKGEKSNFGLLSPDELNMTQCAFEKDAPAVVLFDKGSSRFMDTDNGFMIRFERHTRLKIFKEAGFDYAEVEIPYYIGDNELEQIRNIRGFTYNHVNGIVEKTPFDIKQTYIEKINEHWSVKKFAMPKIKEGSIIEYSYVIESPFIFHFRDWEFQWKIPVKYSEYKAAMIPFYSYRYRIQGVTKLDVFDSYKAKGLERSFASLKFHDMIYKYGLKNVPSFKDEAFISSENDYIIKIDFQLAEVNYPSGYKKTVMTTWPALAKDLLEHEKFGKYLKKTNKYGQKELAHLNLLPEKERAEAIINHVKNNFKWNGYRDKYASKSIKAFLTEKTGNSANMNLMAIGILNGLNIEAQPVIISTRNHGKVTDSFPFSDLFNYVLIMAKVDGKFRIYDATDSYCPNNIIPPQCINGKGFIVAKDSENWINVKNSAPSLKETYLTYTLNTEKNQLIGTCLRKNSNFIAIKERKKYNNDVQEFKKDFLSKGFEIPDSIAINNVDNKSLFTYSFNFSYQTDAIDNSIIVSPFCGMPVNENPFKQETRDLPVDLIYKKGERFVSSFTIPEGYTIEELPSPQKRNSENIHFEFSVRKVNADQLQFIAVYTFRKPKYSAKEYAELKSFMNDVIKKLNGKIILTKTSDALAENSID
ncbi:DUF3857 domain-containing protein [Marinilabiliaceae bacterium JC017]|nr:DUF3857 domain-containing protein [Marinilabiliaceae bacterium JC017]